MLLLWVMEGKIDQPLSHPHVIYSKVQLEGFMSHLPTGDTLKII